LRTSVLSSSRIFTVLPMATVFISHVEEDQTLAMEIAGALERAGYTTWYFERDSSPGLSYLLQVHRAIEACQVVVLVISPRALESVQVTAEVVRAHETGKAFLPVRVGISHEDFRRRKPEWNMAVGAAASIAAPEAGAEAILPEILEGLGLLSAERERKGAHDDMAATDASPAVSRQATASTGRRRAWKWAVAGTGALILLLAIYWPGRDSLVSPAADALQGAVEPLRNGASLPAAAASPAPSRTEAADRAGEVDTGPTAAPKPSPSTATASRVSRDRVPVCAESSAQAHRRVQERGRLEAQDDVSDVIYAFVICEEWNTAKGTVEMQIIGSSTVSTRWSGENAAQKAADLDRRGVECETTAHAVRSSGAHDPRSIAYVLCQASGEPTSIAVHATTRKADASAYPEKVLRVPWPK
jgi:hypothetical protein